MAIKLYYNKSTYQLITIDDGAESLVVGDTGSKEFQFYFGTGTSLVDFVHDTAFITTHEGRAIIERADTSTSNELYLTPTSPAGYYKLIISSWISDIEGDLEITARTKVLVGSTYVVTNYGLATITVEPGADPSGATISDAQYLAVITALDEVIAGTTNITYDPTISGLAAVTVKEAIDEVDDDLDTHIADVANPHETTKAQVGLGSADDTSDVDKPVSTAQQAALDLKADISYVDGQDDAQDLRLDDLETFQDTTVPATYETKSDADTESIRVDNKISTDIGTHNTSGTAHTDIRALISALQGAYVYRGLIAQTTAAIEADTSLLDARILVLMSRTAITGDVIVDSDEYEWYYNGSIWDNMGHNIIGLASAVNDGLMTSEDYVKLSEFQVAANYYTSAQVDALIESIKLIQGVTETPIDTLSDTEYVAMSVINGYDFIHIQAFSDDTYDHHVSQIVRPTNLTNGTIIDFVTGDGYIGKLTVDATNMTYAKVGAFTSHCFVTGISLVDTLAQNVAYVNTTSGLTATDVQEAIDEIVVRVEVIEPIVEQHTLEIRENEMRIDTVEETLRKAVSSSEVGTSADTEVIHLGKDVANAELKVLVEGMTLQATNRIALATGSSNGITITVSGNQVTLAGTASAETTLTLSSGLTASNKAYINFDYVSGSLTGTATLQNGATALHSNLATDYSGVVTLAGTTITIVIASGAVLTALIFKSHNYSATTLIANKQYSPILNSTFDLMSDANIKTQVDYWVANGTLPNDEIQSVGGNKKFMAVGKNLFDKSKVVTGLNQRINEATGGLTTGSANSGDSYTNYIKIKPSTNYKVSGQTHTYSPYAIYDVNKVFVYGSGGAVNFTVPNTITNAYYIRFSLLASNIDVVQLEAGSVATTYEAFTSSEMYLQSHELLGSVNNVKDSEYVRNGKYYRMQRVSDLTDVTGVVAVNTTNYPTAKTGGVFINYLDAGGSETGIIGTNSTSGNGTLQYELAVAVETQIDSSGRLIGSSRGTVYISDAMPDIDIYSTRFDITYNDKLISSINRIVLLGDGVETELAVSGATIAGDGLSFTHAGLSSGDVVFIDYNYINTDNVYGLSTVTYYSAEDDMRFSATQLKQGATTKPDFDFTNIGLLFPQNDATEAIYIVAQMPHDRVADSDIVPHVHVRLAGAGQPVFKIDYKWYNKSAVTIPASFTTYTMNVNSATWSTGTISNTIYGASAISGVGKTSSSIMIIKLYRDDNVYSGDILLDEFDIHYYKVV